MGGTKKFGVNWDPAAATYGRDDVGFADAAPAVANAGSAVWGAMGDLGASIRDYHPEGFDTPVQPPPGPSVLPADNDIRAREAAPAAPAAEARPLTPAERLAIAHQKLDAGAELDGGEWRLLDDENVRLHPGGKTASSTTSGVSRALAPKGKEWDELQAEQMAGAERRQEVRRREVTDIAELSRLQDAHAQAAAQRTDQYGNALIASAAEQQQAQGRYSEQLARDRADQDKANTAYQRAAADYDPNRLMQGGRGVMAALSMAMGAFGSSLTKTPNYALQIVNDAISRDMDKQKAGIAAQKEKATWMDHVMAANREQFKDETTARLMTRASAKEAYANWMEGAALKTANAEQRATAQKAVNDINMSAEADRKQGYDTHEARLRQQAGTATSQTTASQADTVTRPGDLVARVTKEAAAEKLRRDAFGLNGEKYTPAQQKQSVDVTNTLAALAESQKELTRYKQLVGTTNMAGRATDLTQDNHRLTTTQTHLARALTKAQNRGVASDKDEAATAKELTSGAWSSESLNTKADEIMGSAGRTAATQIMALPPGRLRDEAVDRLVGMVGQKQANAWLTENVGAAGSTTATERGTAGGGR
jgi:hypothetical protein